jgi:lysophospholipase L1-like esterase
MTARLGVALLFLMSACGGTHAAASGAITVALGDSVPYGTACGCTPYPQLTADDIAHHVGHSVNASNDAQPGWTTTDVLNQLQHDDGVSSRVQRASVVTVEIGANDVAHSPSCGDELECYAPTLPDVQHNLDTIVGRIHALTHGHPVSVVLVDYWSVWLGGTYAQAQGPEYVQAADNLTAQVDDIIKTVAHNTGSTYVDLRTAFRGPDHDGDETNLLAPDGEHPNAEGQETIAQAIEAAVRVA